MKSIFKIFAIVLITSLTPSCIKNAPGHYEEEIQSLDARVEALEFRVKALGNELYPRFPKQTIVNPDNGHLYRVILKSTFKEDTEIAKKLGGYIATINDEAENTWITKTFFTEPGELIIGLNDIQEEGRFVWRNGEKVNYTNWASGEPNNHGSSEDFTEITSSGKWNDTRYYPGHFVLIEIEK